MTVPISNLILNVLVKDEEFARKVRPHLKQEYFQDEGDKTVYSLIEGFFEKYGKAPPKDSILIDLSNVEKLSEDAFSEAKKTISGIYDDDYEYNQEWLIENAEKFCRDRAIYLAIMKSVKIINGEGKESPSAIPDMLSKALSVGFDANVGHNYFIDAEARHDFYNKKETRIPTGIGMIDKVTGGGFPTKTLICFMSPSGGGKSVVKCAVAANMLRDGVDCLYITMELAEERISQRIDANLLNIPLGELTTIPKAMFVSKINSIKSKTAGQLVIKEYPTGEATVDHFNALMDELDKKLGFKPKVVFVDYLQIVASARYRSNNNMNTYQMQKYVAEELRAFAVKHDVTVITSVQTNRSGYNVSDVDESNIADSAGIIMTADFLMAIIRTDEMKEQNQVMFKQLKNRFGDTMYFQKFMCGMDTSRMKVFDLENPINAVSRKSDEKAQSQIKKPATTAVVSGAGGGLSDWDFDD